MEFQITGPAERASRERKLKRYALLSSLSLPALVVAYVLLLVVSAHYFGPFTDF
jgi:hypothetical protein